MLKELQTFVAVCRWGTFARAGEQIGLTQSAVSAQIVRLERMLGYPVFDRQGRAARLNGAGREVLARAQHLIEAVEELQSPAAAGRHAGLLRIGSIVSVQAAFLPGAIERLRDRHPHLQIRVSPGASLHLLGRVDSGELDVAVMLKPPFPIPAELTWQPLWREPFVLGVPRDAPRDDWRTLLARSPFLRFDRGTFGGRLVNQLLDRSGVAVRDSVEMDDIGGLLALVEQGVGVALLPHCRPFFRRARGARAVGLGDDTLHREIGLLRRVRESRTGLIGDVCQALADVRAH